MFLDENWLEPYEKHFDWLRLLGSEWRNFDRLGCYWSEREEEEQLD